jgi:phosphatidylglycerophosphate synthase
MVAGCSIITTWHKQWERSLAQLAPEESGCLTALLADWPPPVLTPICSPFLACSSISAPRPILQLATGAIIIFFAGFLDMLDGQVARRQNRVTAFGAFYDSTLDRYADMALYMGLLVYYSVSGRTPYVVLAAVATAGSVMVSYARARAESLIPLCKVGFMERPERLVLLIIGGLFNRMAQVLWVIAIVSTITVIHRIFYTWQETKAGRILPNLKTPA